MKEGYVNPRGKLCEAPHATASPHRRRGVEGERRCEKKGGRYSLRTTKEGTAHDDGSGASAFTMRATGAVLKSGERSEDNVDQPERFQSFRRHLRRCYERHLHHRRRFSPNKSQLFKRHWG